jgi:hypothetical protein
MPNLNGRGPFGEGPMTGRGRGRCRKKNLIQTDKVENQLHGENIDASNRLEFGRKSGNHAGKERRRIKNRHR